MQLGLPARVPDFRINDCLDESRDTVRPDGIAARKRKVVVTAYGGTSKLTSLGKFLTAQPLR